MARKLIGDPVLVRLPPNIVDRIAALAPPHGRAQFIRQAVIAELDRLSVLSDNSRADDLDLRL